MAGPVGSREQQEARQKIKQEASETDKVTSDCFSFCLLMICVFVMVLLAKA